MIKMTRKSYTELSHISSFEERVKYLMQPGKVGEVTFGYERYLNQVFYASSIWKSCRRGIIVRDNGCDVGLKGYDIFDKIYVHHINPLTEDDILSNSSNLTDPENLICCSNNTHNVIHFGYSTKGLLLPTERTPGDTKLW